jgi:hypothetical protein
MKITIIYLFLISLLFQSCYSYRTIDLSKTPLIVEKKYKIKQTNNFIKASLINMNDSIATFIVEEKEKK